MHAAILDNAPKARNSDPVTSHKAGRKSKSFAGQHREIIAQALTLLSPEGATVCELSKLTGLEKHAVFRRMSELEVADQVHWNGEREMESGSDGRIWFIGPEPSDEKRKARRNKIIRRIAEGLSKLNNDEFHECVTIAQQLYEKEEAKSVH